jgi:LDH2 family malate/lactate/ureidoglycolate dehydrogenase
VDRIWLPGEQSHARRATYLRDGIPLSAGLMQTLDRLSEQLKVPALRDTAP